MEIGIKEIELFEMLSKQADNNIDKYNLFAGELEKQRSQFDDAFIKLSALKLITIKNDGRAVIIKLPNFHEAIFYGGLKEFIETKTKKEKTEIDLIESNIITNKYSRISVILTTSVSILTLLALMVQIIISLSDN